MPAYPPPGTRYTDAELNSIDAPNGSVAHSKAVFPFPRANANSTTSGAVLSDVQITQNGQYMSVLSNPA